ncbi:protein FAM3C-like isoform 1-T1 [Menidia menidia]
MLTVKVGKANMGRKAGVLKWCLRVAMVLLPVLLLIPFLMQLYGSPVGGGSIFPSFDDLSLFMWPRLPPPTTAGHCFVKQDCPEGQLSFYILSGAANVVGPKICIQNKMVLGTVLNNAGVGINIVTLNGHTGEVQKSGNFNTYDGNVEDLIKFLKDIESGSVVLMVSFDEPGTKLNDEARALIAELGSSSIKTVGFRDSWGFVGAKGLTTQHPFEEYIKNDQLKNKYGGWPELIELKGCIPKQLEKSADSS